MSLDGLGFRGAAGRALGGDTTGGPRRTIAASPPITRTAARAKASRARRTTSGTAASSSNTGVEGYPNGSMARGAPATRAAAAPIPILRQRPERGRRRRRQRRRRRPAAATPGAATSPGAASGGDAMTDPDRGPADHGRRRRRGRPQRLRSQPRRRGRRHRRSSERARSRARERSPRTGLAGVSSGNDGAGGGGAGGRIDRHRRHRHHHRSHRPRERRQRRLRQPHLAARARSRPRLQRGLVARSGRWRWRRRHLRFDRSRGRLLRGRRRGRAHQRDQRRLHRPTTNYNATGGANGFTTTGVTTLVGVQTCAVATHASVCGLRVDPSGTVEFATSSQRGTLGFDLFQRRTRRADVRPRPPHRAALVSPVPSSGTPILYRAETSPITASYLVIEETEVNGTEADDRPLPRRRRADAPRPTSASRSGAREREGGDRRGTRQLSSRRLPHGRDADDERRADWRRRLKRARRVDDGLKLETSAAGPVRATLSDLVAAGLPAAYAARPADAAPVEPRPARALPGGHGPRGRALAAVHGGRRCPPTIPAATPTSCPGARACLRRRPWTSRSPASRAVPASCASSRTCSTPPSWPRARTPGSGTSLLSGVPGGPYTFDLPGLRAGGGAVPRARGR